jgi:hypothetical protein
LIQMSRLFVRRPDVIFEVLELDGNASTIEVVSCEFFGSQLSLQVLNPNGGTLLSNTVIDNTIGQLYTVMKTDLNMDGIDELLVTNHMNVATVSGVYAYEIPTNITTPMWPRHTLATNSSMGPRGRLARLAVRIFFQKYQSRLFIIRVSFPANGLHLLALAIGL